MIESIRCPQCDRLLDAGTIAAGACCTPGDWKPGDVVLNPHTGYIFTASRDNYGNLEWLELAPSAAHSQPNPPRDAVLLVRRVDGKPLPVVDLGDGDLYAVRPVA